MFEGFQGARQQLINGKCKQLSHLTTKEDLNQSDEAIQRSVLRQANE